MQQPTADGIGMKQKGHRFRGPFISSSEAGLLDRRVRRDDLQIVHLSSLTCVTEILIIHVSDANNIVDGRPLEGKHLKSVTWMR